MSGQWFPFMREAAGGSLSELVAISDCDCALTINAVLFPIDLPFGIALLLEFFQHPLPNPGFGPAVKTTRDGAPRAVSELLIPWRASGHL